MKKALETLKVLANHEIVTLAVYPLGGDTQRVDTELTLNLNLPLNLTLPPTLRLRLGL